MKTFGPLNNFDGLSPTTTKGDLIARDTSTNVRIPVGANGSYLQASSGSTGGVAWAAALSNPMTTVGDIIYGGATGSATRLGGNVAASLQYLTSTGAGSTAQAPAWAALTAPTLVVLTSGTTFVTATNALWLRVRMVAGGAGGQGGGTTPGAGAVGTTSVFGTSLICGGGLGAGNSTSGVATGGDININGIAGGNGGDFGTGAAGGAGGDTPLGLGGMQNGGGGGRPPSGYGSGGGGGGSTIQTSLSQGGGSGAYVEKIFVSPAAAYQYTVGTQGAAGTAGTSGQAGATGAPGIILIEQHFQ